MQEFKGNKTGYSIQNQTEMLTICVGSIINMNTCEGNKYIIIINNRNNTDQT